MTTNWEICFSFLYSLFVGVKNECVRLSTKHDQGNCIQKRHLHSEFINLNNGFRKGFHRHKYKDMFVYFYLRVVERVCTDNLSHMDCINSVLRLVSHFIFLFIDVFSRVQCMSKYSDKFFFNISS